MWAGGCGAGAAVACVTCLGVHSTKTCGVQSNRRQQLACRLTDGMQRDQQPPPDCIFLPPQHQYDKLYELASAALGSSLSKHMLKTLVRAYLGI